MKEGNAFEIKGILLFFYKGEKQEKKIFKEFFKKVLKFLKLCCIMILQIRQM